MSFPDLPQLETPRLTLRKFRVGDAPALFAYASDQEVTRYITWRTHTTLEETEDFVDGIQEWYKTGEVAYWAIILKAEQKLVGSCGLFDWQPSAARAELAFVLNRAYWGQDIIPEAVRALMHYGFEQLNLNRIEAKCVAENTNSARVMEKCGMSFEGILRQYMWVKGGYRDLRVYSLLREEWLSHP